jgi:hypothetical protein
MFEHTKSSQFKPRYLQSFYVVLLFPIKQFRLNEFGVMEMVTDGDTLDSESITKETSDNKAVMDYMTKEGTLQNQEDKGICSSYKIIAGPENNVVSDYKMELNPGNLASQLITRRYSYFCHAKSGLVTWKIH